MATCEYDLDLSGGLMEVRIEVFLLQKEIFGPLFAILEALSALAAK